MRYCCVFSVDGSSKPRSRNVQVRSERQGRSLSQLRTAYQFDNSPESSRSAVACCQQLVTFSYVVLVLLIFIKCIYFTGYGTMESENPSIFSLIEMHSCHQQGHVDS